MQPQRRHQGLILFTAILWLIGTLVVIQLWLVAAALDALRSGTTVVLVSMAVASLVLFLLNGGLLLFVVRFDRQALGAPEPPGAAPVVPESRHSEVGGST